MATLTKDQVREIIARAPAGTSPAGIVAALRQTHQLEGFDSTTAVMTATNNPAASRLAGLGHRAAKLLPDVGGFVGGLAGGAAGAAGGALVTLPAGGSGAVPGAYAGAIAGAGLGGAVGEGARAAVTGEKLSAHDIGQSAATQASAEAVGGAIVGAAGKMARPAMRMALGNVAALAKRFNTTSEKIAQLILDEGLPVTEAGAAQAIGKGKIATRSRNAKIAATRGTIGARTLASVAIDDAGKRLGRPLTRAEQDVIVSKIHDEANTILTDMTHGAVPKATPGTASRYTARETEQIKEVAAKNARPEYRASQAAASVAADPSLSKKLAKAARLRLDKIRGVGTDNTKIKNMMVAEQAISDAVRTGSEKWTPLHVGPLSVGLKVPHDKLSGIAHFLNNPKIQFLMRQSPRTVISMLRQLAHVDAQPDTTANPRAAKADSVAKIRSSSK